MRDSQDNLYLFFRQLRKARETQRAEANLIDSAGHPFCVFLETFIEGEIGSGDEQIWLIVTDITERKAMEDQVRHSQKMDAIGQLTGGIAHDYNNMLGVIMGNLDLLKLNASDPERVRTFADTAYRAARRSAELTRKLVNFSRRETGDEKLVSVNEFVAGMEDLISKSLTVSIELSTRLAEDLWPVRIDPGDLEDAILNLALNARDAMPDGGGLIIETANKVLDEDYVRSNPNARAGPCVMVSVSDTGHGMPPDIREQAFEPFFTTKDVGKGTGLGLSMVYGFVQRSNGHMKIYSEPGSGTTVRLYLPRAVAEGVREHGDEPSPDLPRGTETILVVDDEEGLVAIASAYLDELGYTTLTANDGAQALKILEARDDIDLMFSDVIMPNGMDGYQLALAAHEARPGLRILLTSGFTRERETYVNGDRKYLSALTSTLLSKPYTHPELAMAVRNRLDETV